jgi:uncharacterized protein (TIGR02594 family)
MTDLLIEALSHYGLKEVDGVASNPEIIAMGKDLGFDVADDSTTAWCSLLVNYFAKKCGYEYSGKLDARSWLKMPVVALKPSIGDVVVLWRESPSSWKGHVGVFINWDEKNIWILGGNQSNQLNISAYPREQLLGFRKLKKKV